jgi:hypothetical protein
MYYKTEDITRDLVNGILTGARFTPDDAGLAVEMKGFYTIPELKAILEDLIHVNQKFEGNKNA